MSVLPELSPCHLEAPCDRRRAALQIRVELVTSEEREETW